MISFLKQFAFFNTLTQNALIKISYHLQLKWVAQAGKVVFTEGTQSDTIALIKEGEFEICKQTLNDVDPRILPFLYEKDKHKETVKQVNFKPGAKSVFKQTSDLFPAVRPSDIDISRLSAEQIAKLAFHQSDS